MGHRVGRTNAQLGAAAVKQDPVVDEVLALRTEIANLQDKIANRDLLLAMYRTEAERLAKAVKAYEDDRIANLGGIGSPA